MRLVKNDKEVRAGIKQFNNELLTMPGLVDRLGYARAWYFAPDLDLVGPSKFIGYANMTAAIYLNGGSLDGKQTEPALYQCGFRQLENGSPEEALVRSKVEALLVKHGKSMNHAARFCAPIGWKTLGKLASGKSSANAALPHGNLAGRRTIHATISRGESQYVAECEHLAVVTQGATVEKALENLQEAITLYLEGEDLQALGLTPEPVVLVTMELPWAA